MNFFWGFGFESRERFIPITKKAINAYISDSINDTLKSAMQSHRGDEILSEAPAEQTLENVDDTTSKIETTQDELEAFAIIKAILHGIIYPGRLSYKDTESYFGIICDNNVRKWVCRLRISDKKISLNFPDTSYQLNCLDDPFSYNEQLTESATRFKD